MTPNDQLKKNQTIIMGVVATRLTKMWPLKNYASLAKLIVEKNSHTKIIIPLSKSSVDQKIKNELQSFNLPANVVLYEWPLEVLPSVFGQASLYIGNDTGLKHLAVATGVKSYTFFGPEPANEWHPYNSKNHPYFYLEGLSCRTRTHHYCGLSVCDLKEENMQCLTSFTPELVFSEIEKEIYI